MGMADRLRLAVGGEARLPAVREQRDPRAATVSLRYHSPGMPLVPEWQGDQAIRLGYLANVIAYRCIQIIADSLAGVPFAAGLVPPKRPGLPAESNPQARLAQLLGDGHGGPAPKLSAAVLWRWTVAQRLATGRNAWEIETTEPGGKGEVVALWPLVSASTSAIPSDSGSEWFSLFKYGRPDQPVRLQPAQVHYGWTPHPTDFRQPLSPLQSARYDLSIALAADRYSLSFMQNNAVPAHVVAVEEFPDAEDFEAFKRQWQAEYRGPDSAGKTHFVEVDPDSDRPLSESIFVQTLGVSAKDARLIEQHQASLSRVAMALGVPWSKLDASGRTYENADAEERTFWQQTMVPLCQTLAGEVNMDLAPRLGAEVGWFDLSGVDALRARPPVDASGAAVLVAGGIASVAEARAWFGLHGDPPEMEVPDNPENVEVPDAEDDVERGADRGCRGAAGEARRPRPAEGPQAGAEGVPAQVEARATVDQEARRTRLWSGQVKVVLKEQRAWWRAFRDIFAEQRDSTLLRLRNADGVPTSRAKRLTEGRADAHDFFDTSYWTARTRSRMEGLLESTIEAAFVRLSDQLGVSFDLEAEFAQEFIQNRANQLTANVTQTTYDAITAALAEGVGEGEGIPDLAARIEAVFNDMRGPGSFDANSGVRSVAIARTEVTSAFGASTRAAITGLPADVVAAVQWIATPGGRTRESHATADGQIVAVSEPFIVGGHSMLYPGDPAGPADEVINCRCALAALTPEEFEAEAVTYMTAPPPPVPFERARLALALVGPDFDEARFRRALEAA